MATGELLEDFTTENEPESIGIDSADDIFSGEQPDGSNDDQPTSSSAKVTPKRRSSRRKSKDSVGGILFTDIYIRFLFCVSVCCLFACTSRSR